MDLNKSVEKLKPEQSTGMYNATNHAVSNINQNWEVKIFSMDLNKSVENLKPEQYTGMYNATNHNKTKDLSHNIFHAIYEPSYHILSRCPLRTHKSATLDKKLHSNINSKILVER